MNAFKNYRIHLEFQKQLFRLFFQYIPFDFNFRALQTVSIHDVIFFHFFLIPTLDSLKNYRCFLL